MSFFEERPLLNIKAKEPFANSLEVAGGEPVLGPLYTFGDGWYSGAPWGTGAGPDGPTQAELNNIYTGTTLEGLVQSINGLQKFTIPTTGVYRVTVFGSIGYAYNSYSGKPALIIGDVQFSAGDAPYITVGQRPTSMGGGGASAVMLHDGNGDFDHPLIVAGGGGVFWVWGNPDGADAIIEDNNPTCHFEAINLLPPSDNGYSELGQCNASVSYYEDCSDWDCSWESPYDTESVYGKGIYSSPEGYPDGWRGAGVGWSGGFGGGVSGGVSEPDCGGGNCFDNSTGMAEWIVFGGAGGALGGNSGELVRGNADWNDNFDPNFGDPYFSGAGTSCVHSSVSLISAGHLDNTSRAFVTFQLLEGPSEAVSAKSSIILPKQLKIQL